MLSINEKLAWAAGFFDGEGHVSTQIRKQKNRKCITRKINITIPQSSDSGIPEVLEKWVDAIGFGKIFAKKPTGSRKQPYVVSYDSYTDVVMIKELLWPWLGEVKRKQFEDSLEKYYSLPIERK